MARHDSPGSLSRPALRWLAAAGALALALPALAGCSGSGSGAGPIGTAATGASTGGSAGATGTSGAGPGTGPAGGSGTGAPGGASSTAGGTATGSRSSAAAPTCTAAQLTIAAGPAGGAAGHLYLPVLFRNSGTSACSLRGYPGVDALDAAGHRVVAATRVGGTPINRITLAPGGAASAMVGAVDVPIGTATACPKAYAGLLVTPPNLTTSVRVAASLPACAGLTVNPLVAGANGM